MDNTPTHVRLEDGRIGQFYRTHFAGNIIFIPCYIGSHKELADEDHVSVSTMTPSVCVCDPMVNGERIVPTGLPKENEND